MKTTKIPIKKVLLCLVLLALPLVLYPKTIQVEIDDADFNFIEIENLSLISSEKYLLQYSADSLSTPLPYFTINIHLDGEINSYSISVKDSLVRPNFDPIKPNQEVPTIMLGKGTNFVENYTDNIIDQYKIAEINGVQRFRDNIIANFKIYPFSLNPSDGSLYIHKKINIEIDEKKDCPTVEYNDVFSEKALKNLTLNYVDTTVQNINIQTKSQNRCLIITNNNLKNAFELLANWKTQKGIKTKILCIEEIESKYTELSLPVKIKHAISDIYHEEDKNLEYVLLGGDESIVPSMQCFVKYFDYSDTTPTDLFYSCLDNLDWDTNGNGLYGEVSDSIDITPEIIVSRISVTTLNEANNVISRLLNYERSPNTNNWKNDILMCGSKISNFKIDNNTGMTISDVQYNGEALYNDIISKYWICDRIRLYDTGTDFIGNENYEFNESNLQLELSKGYTIAHIDTHGSNSLLQTEGGYYTSNLASSLFNTGNTIIITSACKTNMFDSQMCLSESFMCNPNGGILSYLGSSRYGWSVSSNDFNRVIYDYLLKDNDKQIGKALFSTKLYYAGNSLNYNTPKRWLMFSLNLLGDPEMPVYMSEPKRFESVKLVKDDNILKINTGVEGCRICVMSLNDFGETYYSYVENVTDATFENLPNDISICITKQDYIPSTTIFTKNLYLQNIQYNQDLNIYSDNVYMGNNVSSTVDIGPVGINDGIFKIYYTDELLLDSEVEIKKGVSFEAKVFK